MTVTEAPERFVTKAELSDHLGMTERWIEMQMKAGLPHVRFGRAVRYKITEVEAFLLNS